jgi:membrane-bound serine protease (ClpP class)
MSFIVRYNNQVNMLLRRIFLLASLGVILLSLVISLPVRAQAENPVIVVLTADGPITPAMASYLSRGIRIAERQGAEALIFQLDTPGGGLTTMEQMEQDILASSVPVVVYVAPSGAMAASAGTIITLAAHASSMAPNTTIGAASPVGGQGENLPSTEETKVKNAMSATVRSLTKRRGPTAQALAEDTIQNAAAVSESEALQAGLIDFISTDLNQLRSQLEGFTVTVNGQPVTLHTANATFEPINISLIEELLLIVTDPNIVFLFITIGVQAIIIEISSPGGWVAGFIGVVCLALATYGLGILPVNYFGLLFIVTSFILFILDIKAPTHGALTAAGIGSLIVGALVLFNTPTTPSFQHVSVPLVVIVSIVSGLVFFTIMMIAVRAQQTPIHTGEESLVGREGIARTDLNPKGSVQLGGELWTAELENADAAKLRAGARIQVVRVDGLRLIVRKAE